MSSPAPKTAAPAEGDHRKRRRNRTTQSCLNCHTTKRMCDRKRPCTRCSQLGITGNCVYEVDDPNRQGKPNEGARLMKRIAELESVIRELKNKPHPRWVAEQGTSSPGNSSSPRSPRITPPHSPNNNAGWPAPPSPGFGSVPAPNLSPGAPGPSTIPGSPKPGDPLASLIAAYTGLTDHMFVRQGSNCGCLNETECYSVVLELSLRLRRTADVLSRSPSHLSNTDCALNSHIAELDMFAKNSLLDVPSYQSSLTPGPARSFGSGRSNPPNSPPLFDQSYPATLGTAWDMGPQDNFMSWVPAQRNF